MRRPSGEIRPDVADAVSSGLPPLRSDACGSAYGHNSRSVRLYGKPEISARRRRSCIVACFSFGRLAVTPTISVHAIGRSGVVKWRPEQLREGSFDRASQPRARGEPPGGAVVYFNHWLSVRVRRGASGRTE